MVAETLLAGLLVSFAFGEALGVTPGGLVVPGMLALYAAEPSRYVGTAAVSLASLGLYRLLSARLILFGRRSFFAIVGAAGILSIAGSMLFPALFPGAGDLRAVGVIVPGLIANSCRRQGTLPTMAAATVATAAVALLVKLGGALWGLS